MTMFKFEPTFGSDPGGGSGACHWSGRSGYHPN
jgi:hypothetical protein